MVFNSKVRGLFFVWGNLVIRQYLLLEFGSDGVFIFVFREFSTQRDMYSFGELSSQAGFYIFYIFSSFHCPKHACRQTGYTNLPLGVNVCVHGALPK